MLNKGAVALFRAAKRRGLKTQRALASEAASDEPRISRLLSGKIKPNRQESLGFRDSFGIDPALWDENATEAEEAEVDEGLHDRPRVAATGTDDAKAGG